MAGVDRGPERALDRAWQVVGWIGVVALVVLCLIPQAPSFTPYEHEDKVQHALAYAALMLWFSQLHLTLRARGATALLLLALGIGIEFVQGWLGTRMFSPADMIADAAGIVLGWLAAPPRGPNLLANFGRMLTDLR
jgi:VanZ family protein